MSLIRLHAVDGASVATQVVRDETSELLEQLRTAGEASAAVAVGFALEALDEACHRLGVPVAGHPDDAQKDPLVLRVQTRVRPDQ